MKSLPLLLVGLLMSAGVAAQATDEASAATPAAAPVPYSGRVRIDVDPSFSPDGKTKPDTVLRVVAPSERGKDIALIALGALFGGLRTPVAKEDYKGERIDAVAHPAVTDLSLRLQPAIDGWLAAHADDRSFKNPLWIRLGRFQLVYRESGDTAPYDLKIEALIGRKRDSAGFFVTGETVSCSLSDTDASHTLADWQQDDYARVKTAGKRFVDDCVGAAGTQLAVLLAP